MSRRYTGAETAWLAANYHAGTINDTLDAFEREFGRRPSKQGIFVKANKMGLHKDAHGSERHVPAQRIVRWSSPECAEMEAWMLEHDTGESVYATIDAFEAEFGIRLNRSQVSGFRASHGTSKRKSHGGGRPALPVGTERVGKDGYIVVKTRMYPKVPQSKDNWRFKHHLAYERAHGWIPHGSVVMFADGDKRNFDPANLVAVPRKYIGMLNNPELPEWHDAETLKAVMAWLDLHQATIDAIHRQRRRCRVCGEWFVERDDQRGRPKPVQTCPRCIASGVKWAGDRSVGRGTCIVCGREYDKAKRNQKRCPECIAEHPTLSPAQHARRNAC